jgi:hypothetical protein
MIFGKLFYVIVIVLSFGGLWKILGPARPVMATLTFENGTKLLIKI